MDCDCLPCVVCLVDMANLLSDGVEKNTVLPFVNHIQFSVVYVRVPCNEPRKANLFHLLFVVCLGHIEEIVQRQFSHSYYLLLVNSGLILSQYAATTGSTIQSMPIAVLIAAWVLLNLAKSLKFLVVEDSVEFVVHLAAIVEDVGNSR